MDYNSGRQRRPKEERNTSYRDENQRIRIPRPPPGAYQQQQQRPMPAQGQQRSEHRQDRPHQPSGRVDFRSRYQGFHTPQRSEVDDELQPPLPVSHSPGRHFSHISALSTSQQNFDSRPVSEITADAVTPKNAVFDADQIQGFPTPPSAPITKSNSRGRSRASSNGSRRQPAHTDRTPSSDAAATMQALTSAIRQGLGPSKASSRSGTHKPFADGSAMRMPFQDEPGSPTSIYTEVTATQNRNTLPLSTYKDYDLRSSKPSTISEQDIQDYEKSRFAGDLPTPMSHISSHATIDKEGYGMSSRVPVSKRPPRLDMAAVREAEGRGSMTSLPDLIKRATRLASNLDRGRTASLLGHLDMFGSSEKLDGNRVRNSTYSDVLAAFPPPADRAGTPGCDRPATMWPAGEKQFMASKSSLGRHGDGTDVKRRRCCGLSPLAFVSILAVLVILVAAAVLIPVFLIVLPKQHQKTVGECSSSHVCRNQGVAVVVNDQCSCICVDAFTGSDCSQEGDPECVTASIQDGTRIYENATMANGVRSILEPGRQTHGIPLNITTILATFAANNLSCAGENSLVMFAQNERQRARRSLRLIEEAVVPYKIQLLESNAALIPRQDAVQSSNGIVYATSSQASRTSQPTATSTLASTTPTATATGQRRVSNETFDFAASVVLYVVQTNAQINSAVMAKQAMTAYFAESDPANHTIQVVGAPYSILVNFDSLEVSLANGTRFGGT